MYSKLQRNERYSSTGELSREVYLSTFFEPVGFSKRIERANARRSFVVRSYLIVEVVADVDFVPRSRS